MGISYDPKVRAFLKYIGQEPCMELGEASADRLIKYIDDAVRRSSDRNARMLAAEKLRETEKHNVEAARRMLS